MTLTSIMSFPDRGKWGNSKYRGNCSGYVPKTLLEHFKPKKVTEVFAGGGTMRDVCSEMGYSDSIHLDLNPAYGGWNALRDEMPVGSDFIFSHPAYHNIIVYSGEMWGDKPHPDDLSRCESYEDFLQKLNFVNEKMFHSLRNGGRMAILIGDVRRNGEYFPIFSDMRRIGKLESIIIKEQHNVVSNKTNYSGKFIPIMHEYVMIFRKDNPYFIPYSFQLSLDYDIRNDRNATWRDIVQACLEKLGGKATLNELYQEIEGVERTKDNAFWKDKVRQVLNQHKRDFSPVDRGIWKIAS